MKEKKNKTFSSSPLFSMEDDDLVEEREEVMVNPSVNSKKTHLLKLFCSTSIDRFEASPLPPDSKALSFSVSFTGWRFANIKFKSWATKMAISYSPIWKQAGIFEAVMASTATIRKDTDLVLGIAEKWCPKTNTFVFPWGEATITLEDVMVLLNFSVLGSPVFAALDSEGRKIKKKLVGDLNKIAKDNEAGYVTQAGWMERFMGCGGELEHVAFLVVWLCYFVFPSRYHRIYPDVFPIAVHLSRGTRIALAPAVLARLYADLSILKTHLRSFTKSKDANKIALTGLFKLVQVWTWERFRDLQPEPNPLIKGETRLALWHDPRYRTSRVRQVLDNNSINSFEWRPYTKPVENWEFPQFYPEKGMFVPVGPNLDDEFVSFARCFKVSKLVGIGCVEHYFPNRVALQFGMHQDVPGTIKRNNLSQEAAWTDYSKLIEDLTLYIPSRSANGCVTPVFKEWWRKSISELKGSSEENLVAETVKPRYITYKRRKDMNDKRLKCRKRVRGDQENSFALSSCKMKRTSEDVRIIAANFINKRRKLMKLTRDKRRKYMKRVRENNETAIENEDSNDGLTIAQVMRLGKKKYSNAKNSGEDASEWLGETEKSILEADINDSDPRIVQVLTGADGDETLQSTEKETGSKSGNNMVMSKTDENQSSDPPLGSNEAIDIVVSPPETRKPCEDEPGVNGSNAEKMTMNDDSSKEPECLLHEDDAIAGEKASSDEKEDDVVGLIQQKLVSKPQNNEPPLRQKLANGHETSKAYKSMVPSSDESNIHIAAGNESQEHDCLLHGNAPRSKVTRKTKEQLKRRKEDVGKDNLCNDSSYQKSLHNLQVMSDSIAKSTEETKRKVALLKERKALRQRKLAAARLI